PNRPFARERQPPPDRNQKGPNPFAHAPEQDPGGHANGGVGGQTPQADGMSKRPQHHLPTQRAADIAQQNQANRGGKPAPIHLVERGEKQIPAESYTT